ncbi:MAG: polysaccharide deacetylase family protein [Candidatus Wildermuthbacteria bacterium]|nr:polysaccharide deacetylase family protein [Candidatus Wildermuthbacteria bacterium]
MKNAVKIFIMAAAGLGALIFTGATALFALIVFTGTPYTLSAENTFASIQTSAAKTFIVAYEMIVEKNPLPFLPSGAVSSERYELHSPYGAYLGEIYDSTKGEFVYGVDTAEKIIAITFDDGPDANTPAIIETLKQFNAPATFFVVADNLTLSNAALYRHPLIEVGIHGLTHEDYTKYSLETCRENLQQAKNKLAEHNLQSTYFRPPFGTINASLFQCVISQDLKGILWNLDSLDWKENMPAENIAENVLSNVKHGDIILFHDIIDKAALETILYQLRQKEFTIVPLSSLLLYPPITPP